MKITKLTVKIGEHTQNVLDVNGENLDVKQLIELATASSATIKIEVPQTSETASMLGRLVYGQPKASPPTDLSDKIDDLCKRRSELELSVRANNVLKDKGIEFVWQIAECSESDLLRLKDFGRKSLNEVKEIMSAMGLRLNMDLSNIKEHLPTV